MGPLKTKKTEQAAEAGDLLNVVALDRNGVLVTSEGALVRILEVTPRNPNVMGIAEQQRVSEGFAAMAGRLKVGQSLQFYIDAAPIQLDDVINTQRTEIERRLAAHDTATAEGLRKLAHAHEESLREHASDQAAVRFRTYVVVPWIAATTTRKVDWEALRPSRWRGVPHAPLSRALDDHQRVLRESLVHTENITSDLQALDLSTRLLTGPDVAELLYRRFNPSSVAVGYVPRLEVLGELDAVADARSAVQAAERVRDKIAASPIDFDDPRYVRVEQDLERVHYVSSIPDFTEFGWLLSAMEIARPFTLTVHVHGLDRRAERTKIRNRRKRMHAFTQRAAADGRIPDDDMLAQHDESRQLLDELRGRERASIHAVSIYQSVREPGGLADPARLVEASEQAVAAIRDATDADAKYGGWMQRDLWLSTLPLGRDVAKRTKRYVSRHVGDTIPLVGPSCSSPNGLPFFFADGVRTLAYMNPWDRKFINGLAIVNGLQGSGKTMFGILTAARLLPYGVQITVLDRSGHWEMLTQLVPGAAHLSLGAGSSAATINPWDVADPARVTGEKVTFLRDLHELLIGDYQGAADRHALSEDERNYLSEAIRAVYARCAREHRSPLERDLRDELRRMEQTERDAANGAITARASRLGSLADRLARYVLDGEDAWLVDRPTNVPTDAAMVVYDTRAARSQLAPAMFINLEHTVNKIRARQQQRMANLQVPEPLFPGDALFSDELWSLLRFRATGEYVHDISRRSRQLGLFNLAITQHLTDLDNEFGRALLRSASMKLFFQQSPEELRYVQSAVGLSDNEVRLISGLHTSKGHYAQGYWINGPWGRGKVNLIVGGLEYWLATNEPSRDVPLRNAALARHPNDPWAALQELADTPGIR